MLALSVSLLAFGNLQRKSFIRENKKMVKKIELHNHLEGTASPKLIQKIARRNGLNLNHQIISKCGNYFLWDDFLSFLSVYEQASQVIKQPLDYYDITYDYLKNCALNEAIYVEMMYSPEHAENASGIPSKEHMIAIGEAIDNAQRDYGILGRIINVAVRHYGIEACENTAKRALTEPHNYVTGFGLAGDEQGFPPKQFKRAFDIANDANLGCTVHAGEMQGPELIKEALDNLPVTRLGHGVRAIEDLLLMRRLKEENIHLEICPSSNIILDVYPTLALHPLRKMYDYGLSLSLNSDDPPYFKCSLSGEYELAQKHFDFTHDELKNISLMAVDAAFLEEENKQILRTRIIEDK